MSHGMNTTAEIIATIGMMILRTLKHAQYTHPIG